MSFLPYDIPIYGNRPNAEARLDFIVMRLRDWSVGDHPFRADLYWWQRLMAAPSTAERVVEAVALGAGGRLQAVIHGVDVLDAVTAAVDYPAVVAALGAGDVLTVMEAESTHRITVIDNKRWLSESPIAPADRPAVAAVLRRAADELNPQRSHCPLCLSGGGPLRAQDWPDHLLSAHADLIGARGLAAQPREAI